MLLHKLRGLVNSAWADVFMAVAITTLITITGLDGSIVPVVGGKFGFWDVVLTCVVNLPIALRRFVPMSMLLLSSAASFVFMVTSAGNSMNVWATFILLYTVVTVGSAAQAKIAVVVVVGELFYSAIHAYALLPSVGVAITFPLVIWSFARSQRANQLLAESAREQATRAVTDERIRIARELHDVVAHHMSIAAIHAGLAQYVFDSDPEEARKALGVIAETSHEGLLEMRRLLSLLRIGGGGEEQLSEQAGLAQLGDLADRISAAGMLTTVTVQGYPQPLAPGPDLCAYRVVQESLTNVLKHAKSAKVDITVSYSSGNVRISVIDDGIPSGNSTGSGLGIIGMRERAKIYGGTLQAGKRPEGGFGVILSLPLDSRVEREERAADDTSSDRR